MVGDEPQAAPDPAHTSLTTPEMVEMEVMFTRTQRAADHPPRKATQIHVWIVQLRGGKVTRFTPDAS